jgi:hypothetical protein
VRCRSRLKPTASIGLSAFTKPGPVRLGGTTSPRKRLAELPLFAFGKNAALRCPSDLKRWHARLLVKGGSDTASIPPGIPVLTDLRHAFSSNSCVKRRGLRRARDKRALVSSILADRKKFGDFRADSAQCGRLE